ncbi:hypothetical protein CK203_023145 [Vitis vinifera]|uniref:Uncharacterized protein n=1 Tax=Vitis vinifera TaxID=29760 RepID=A0A438J1V5_VITVI|nr:hypothetical protein CK203_023145 [Vitis vinifera]
MLRRVLRQPPPTTTRPVKGTSAPDEVRREDDKILRQLQSSQARISIWSLLASSSTHRDALIRALSHIRVETTTTPKGLIHMMIAGRATCIVFSDDDLAPEGSDHTRPLYISVGCLGRRVQSVLLDNGSALNVCFLATTITLGYAPSDFDPSTKTVRAYDNTRREVMDTLKIELLIGLTTFIIVFQISHSDDDLLLTGFTFDEEQTLEIEDFFQEFMAMLFDQHGSIVALDMMRNMSYLPSMGLERRQHGPSEFMTFPDHNVPFKLGFIPTEADYRYMARLHKERVRAQLTHTPFDYPVCPYTLSLTDYFVRASEPQTPLDKIIGRLITTQEAELQLLVQQL